MNPHTRKQFARAAAAAAFLAAASLAGAEAAPAGTFTLKVTPGPEYKASTTILLLIKIPLYPQMACWIETPDGGYAGTVYVTAKGAKRNFFSAPAAGRPEALPVWYHRQALNKAATDAVSGATASTSADHEARLTLAPGRYTAFLEVNRSYDYNERYTRASSGVNGQPSLVYRAEIVVGKDPSRAAFAPVGTGSVDGSDGGIHPGLEGITTALALIDHAELLYGGKP
jgi:hypothetical protein